MKTSRNKLAKTRKKTFKVLAHLAIAVLFFGFWLPFSISHKSNVLPVAGFATLAMYIVYYSPIIYKSIKNISR